ncbi:DUF21-domain-containing protein [Mycena venus]|uniref:DUF21-domain-containing protein n=1 Tax=Mycena venus TaxID=2733690 RepID=A0A8H6YRP3_9AGAR|nr:DUF21-domain-containing protein [Mycena venus]
MRHSPCPRAHPVWGMLMLAVQRVRIPAHRPGEGLRAALEAEACRDDIKTMWQTGGAPLLLISRTPGKPGGAFGVITLEDIIDETDRCEDNMTPLQARRITSATVMRGCIWGSSSGSVAAPPLAQLPTPTVVRSRSRERTPLVANGVGPCFD